jgi:putative effector of murein hydrolase LrgA (UPF0299 family)
VLAFIGTFVLSLFVAWLAALHLADYFGAADALVMTAILAFNLIGLGVFAVTHLRANEARSFNYVAAALVVLAGALAALPMVHTWPFGQSLVSANGGDRDLQLTLELLIPSLVTVLAQWGLVRQRWQRLRGAEEISGWPWVTTVLAGIAALNPIGLDFIWQALQRSPTDWTGYISLMTVLSGALTAVVMGWVECYIRGWMLRRRLGHTLPPAMHEQRAAG